MTASAHRGLVVLLLVALASTHSRTVANAAVLCSDASMAAEYRPTRALMDTCERTFKIPLNTTLSVLQKDKLCGACPALLAVVEKPDSSLPTCSVPFGTSEVLLIRKLLERQFRRCLTNASTSDSDTGSLGAGNATPSPAPSSLRTSTNSPVNLEANGAPNSSPPPSTDSSMNTGVLIGVTAGAVVALVLVAVVFVVYRRKRQQRSGRHRGDSDKFDVSVLGDDVDGAQSTGRTSTAPFQMSLANSSNHLSSSSSAPPFRPGSSLGPVPPGMNLWEDEIIIAARVPKDKVYVNALLSRGGFGEVYQGLYNRQPVAIKTLLPETRKDLQEINALLAEVKLMATLEHERIVTFIGVAWDSLTDICVLSEFMEGGDLRGLVMRFEADRRPHGFDHDKIKIALHVAHALTYLHSLRPIVLHRDLKSKNILLNSHLDAKLTDFGVSRESSYRTMTAGVGTSLWMAPEVMLGGRYDEKADVFSFGVVLSEIDTHAVPYRHFQESSATAGHRIPDTAVLQMVSLGRLQVRFSPGAHAEIVALATACIALDPSQRPSAADALYTLHGILKNSV